jgi:hypothetical protein
MIMVRDLGGDRTCFSQGRGVISLLGESESGLPPEKYCCARRPDKIPIGQTSTVVNKQEV